MTETSHTSANTLLAGARAHASCCAVVADRGGVALSGVTGGPGEKLEGYLTSFRRR